MYHVIHKYFYNMTHPPTLGEIIEQKMKVEAQTIIDSEHVIKTHCFQKHMSQSTLKALEDWNKLQRAEQVRKEIST